jgi:hypothetical protein
MFKKGCISLGSFYRPCIAISRFLQGCSICKRYHAHRQYYMAAVFNLLKLLFKPACLTNREQFHESLRRDCAFHRILFMQISNQDYKLRKNNRIKHRIRYKYEDGCICSGGGTEETDRCNKSTGVKLFRSANQQMYPARNSTTCVPVW